MEQVFTKEETATAFAVVSEGLQEAAKSLSFFTKSDTRLDLGDDFSITDTFDVEEIVKKEDDLFLLTTELLGELKGVSYLIFTAEEVKSIMKARYPNKEFDEVKFKRKSEGLILEMDNIITAGVMSKFANAFSYRTYGGVPKLDRVDSVKAIEIMKAGIGVHEYILKFRAKLISDAANIQAEFVWSVNQAFIDGIKALK